MILLEQTANKAACKMAPLKLSVKHAAWREAKVTSIYEDLEL